MAKVDLTYSELLDRAAKLPIGGKVYGIPNGGVYAALLASVAHPGRIELVERPEDADFFIDDIIDSGRTRERFLKYGKPFYALVDKTNGDAKWAGTWICFWWERMRREDGAEDAVRRLLQYIGEDPDRNGLKDTPGRVCRALREMTQGYQMDPAAILARTFDDSYDELVLVRGVPFSSLCEHHVLPFTGTADVGYIPGEGGPVVGLSKLARLVDCFAKRLQLQERLTRQVAEALQQHLNPKGVAVVVRASHSCLSCRGAAKAGAEMVTSSLLGVFRDKPEARAEFMALTRRGG